MNNEFSYAEVNTVDDDFAGHKGQYDALMEDAIKDLSAAMKKVKGHREASNYSDDIAELMERHGAKFGKALGSATKEERKEWTPQLAEILAKAIDMEPQNTESIIQSAYQLEKACEGMESGVFSGVLEKTLLRHGGQIKEIMATVDDCMKDYDAQSQKDASTYRAFGKIYSRAFAKTSNKAYADKANAIMEKTEVLKGNLRVEKMLETLRENPANEAVQDEFERKFELLMTENPKAGAEDVLENLRNITKIENAEDREFVYGVVIDVMGRKIKADTAEEKERKSSVMFSTFDMFLKHEKNPELRKFTTACAVMAIKNGLLDDKGGLIIDDISEIETFRSLKRMADSYGNYVGFKDLLADTAAKYGKSKDKTEELRGCMLKVLDFEERNGISVDPASRSDFERSVMKDKKERDNKTRLDTEIFKLLNVPHKTNGFTKDPKKPAVPSREDMLKIANLLFQYKAIEYSVSYEILNKMDKKNFSNVDDAILDKLEKNIDKMQYGEDVSKELVSVRTQMHTRNIKEKKVTQWHEEKAEKKPPLDPKKRISFSVNDLPIDMGIEK